MKAFYQLTYNKEDRDKYGDFPDPTPVAGQILINVKAVSINPVDYKIKNGNLRFIVKANFPKIVGSDFAGVVKKIGTGVTGFKPGDRVYGAVPIFFAQQGALAELLCIETKYARLIPENMSFEDAASLPVASLTALNGLRRCRINNGSNILINGATGGVGHFAVQIAKAKGAFVTAVCSESNCSLAKSFGADNTLDYSDASASNNGEKYDAILDGWGKMRYGQILHFLSRGGTYASPLFLPTSLIPAFFITLLFNKKLTSSNMRSLPEDYEEIERLFAEKKLKPFIENIFPLERAAEAFDKAETGRPRGKVIITL